MYPALPYIQLPPLHLCPCRSCTHITAAVAAKLLPPSHPHRCVVASTLLPPLHLYLCRHCIYVAAAVASTSLLLLHLRCSRSCTHIAAIVADKLLPPTHPHCCRCCIYVAAAVTSTLLLPSLPHCRCRPTRLQHATLILHLLQSYPQNQSKCILLPPIA
jgi:hypothetical protein